MLSSPHIITPNSLYRLPNLLPKSLLTTQPATPYVSASSGPCKKRLHLHIVWSHVFAGCEGARASERRRVRDVTVRRVYCVIRGIFVSEGRRGNGERKGERDVRLEERVKRAMQRVCGIGWRYYLLRGARCAYACILHMNVLFYSCPVQPQFPLRRLRCASPHHCLLSVPTFSFSAPASFGPGPGWRVQNEGEAEEAGRSKHPPYAIHPTSAPAPNSGLPWPVLVPVQASEVEKKEPAEGREERVKKKEEEEEDRG